MICVPLFGDQPENAKKLKVPFLFLIYIVIEQYDAIILKVNEIILVIVRTDSIIKSQIL